MIAGFHDPASGHAVVQPATLGVEDDASDEEKRMGGIRDRKSMSVLWMAGVPDEVLARFSRRTADIRVRTQVKLDRSRENLGHEPTVMERWGLEREAVTDSRPSKPKGVSAAELHRTWRHELASTGIEPETLIDRVTARITGRHLSGGRSAHIDAADARRLAW